MNIDSHQHFWRYNSTEYGWIQPEYTSLQRDFLPADLNPLLDACGIDGSIAVQARQMTKETDWPVCTLAGQYVPVIEIVIEYAKRLSDSERDAVLGRTCAQFYGIVQQEERGI